MPFCAQDADPHKLLFPKVLGQLAQVSGGIGAGGKGRAGNASLPLLCLGGPSSSIASSVDGSARVPGPVGLQPLSVHSSLWFCPGLHVRWPPCLVGFCAASPPTWQISSCIIHPTNFLS